MKSRRSDRFNAFQANVPILYSLKTPENQRYSDVFRGYKKGTFNRGKNQSDIVKKLSRIR